MIRGLKSVLLFVFLPCGLTFLPFSLSPLLPTHAADRTLAVTIDEPVEISMPPSDSLTEWVASEVPESILEQVSVRRLPAETVFVFKPISTGIGVIRFAKKIVGSVGAMSQTVWQEVEVMVTAGKSTPAKSSGPPAHGVVQPPPGGSRAPTEPLPKFLSDPLILQMLEGRLGFPAKNPDPPSEGDTEAARRKKYPLPFSFSYVIPPGSYLLNPTHVLPLPDTPPGVDTAPPAYHQALELAKRGLLKQAQSAVEGLLAEQRSKKIRTPQMESFYEFMSGHLQLQAKEYEESIKKFKSLFKDKDYGIGSRFYAALATESSGDTLEAIAAYQGVISHNPEGYFTPEAAYRISSIFLNARAYERAMKEYLHFIETYPRSPFIDDAIMDLAHIYDQIYDHQNFDLALKLYEGLIGEYGESPYLDSAAARKKFILENYF